MSAFRICKIFNDVITNKVYRSVYVRFGRFSDFKWRTVYFKCVMPRKSNPAYPLLSKLCVSRSEDRYEFSFLKIYVLRDTEIKISGISYVKINVFALQKLCLILMDSIMDNGSELIASISL